MNDQPWTVSVETASWIAITASAILGLLALANHDWGTVLIFATIIGVLLFLLKLKWEDDQELDEPTTMEED